jgi:transcriptional regulator of acetoin/glycerol metabolism
MDDLEEGEIFEGDDYDAAQAAAEEEESSQRASQLLDDLRQNLLNNDNDVTTLSWEEVLKKIELDPSSLDLHKHLDWDGNAEELETVLQHLADENDELMIEIRQIASTVSKMPMAPILCLRASLDFNLLPHATPARLTGKVNCQPARFTGVHNAVKSAADMLLRARRANISTSVEGHERTPFRGYAADFDALIGW